MPDPALQAYLASKYLSGPKADAILSRHGADTAEVKKKRKKRRPEGEASASSSSAAAFRLKDDDDESWKRSGNGSDDEVGGAQVVQGARNDGAFKKARMMALDKDGNRVVVGEELEVGEDAPQMATDDGMGMDEGQRAKLQGELEAQARKAAQGDDDVEERQEEEKPKKKLKAGLKSKEEVRAERLAREEAKRREAESGVVAKKEESRSALAQGQETETVYRDASGRRIDIAAEEEELRRQARQAELKERERKEWTKGQVQREEAQRQRQELKAMEKEGVARYATDKSYNDTLRGLERVDDPALAFLTKKRDKGPQKPKYKGPPPPPNRFGIQPGYRWDGVDRGNGFEKMLFQKRNERSRREAMGHAMDMEDL